MTEQNKSGEPAAGEIDYKAELEKLKSEHESLKKSNEELRIEFMGEDYLQFLETKNKPASEPAKAPVQTQSGDDEFKNLTPKQIYEKAKADAAAEAKKIVSEAEENRKKQENEKAAAEVKKFAAAHPDFEKYRDLMWSFSNQAKYADHSLPELYEEAKRYVKSLVDGPTEAEKEKSRKATGEKPGASTTSFQRGGRKLSAAELDEEAWAEAVGKDGLPPAI